MKYNKPHIYAYIAFGLFITFLLVKISTSSILIIKFDTSSIEQLRDQNRQADSLFVEINKDDIKKLDSIVEKIKINNLDENKLINILEKQRESYLQIIIILSLLIAATGLYNIVYSLTSRSDQEKLYTLMNSMKKDFKNEKLSSLNRFIREESMKLFDNKFNLISTTTDKKIESIPEFIDWLKGGIEKFVEEYTSIGKIDILFKDSQLLHSLTNYIYSSNRFAKENGWLKIASYNVTENSLFNFWISYFKTKMDDESFNKLKDSIKQKYSKVDFGDY